MLPRNRPRCSRKCRGMGKRHPNPRLVKIHRTYSIDEIARLFRCHPNTVRSWQRQGLKPIDGRRPILFHGEVIATFLRQRRVDAKHPCPPGHIYCLPCREPKQPAGDMAEYVPITATTGNLRGICPTCDRLIHRRVNRMKLPAIQGELEVMFREAESHIEGQSNPP